MGKIIIKITIFSGLLVIITFYCFKSIFDLSGLISKYQELNPRYISLFNENNNLNVQKNIMLNKVSGLREATLNKNILAERAKLIMNYKNIDEFVINN